MLKYVLLALITGTSCLAQESATLEIGSVAIGGIPMSSSPEPTTVTLQPTTKLDAVAEIIFRNVDVNGPADTKMYTLVTDTITVDVYFEYTEGEDSLSVYVPDGYFADPMHISIPENTTSEPIYIYPIIFLGS
jgi:hypothetical protein